MIEFSILCLERKKMKDAVSQILPLVDSVHLDVMDGTFVPSEAYTPEFINAFDTDRPKHVHVMSLEPIKVLKQLESIHSFNFHVEAVDNPYPVIDEAKKRGIEVGICLNPETDVSKVEEMIPYLDRVVLMAVTPGFSGQKYIPATSERIIKLRAMSPDVNIIIDGGMHEDTIREVMTLGANACVVCSVIVKSGDWGAKIHQLKESAKIGHNNGRILNARNKSS